MWLERLVNLKRASGKTTKQISAISGVPVGTLNKLFAGQTEDPKLKTVQAVVHALGYTLDDLDSARNVNWLSPQETKIALAYRAANADDKTVVEITLKKYMEQEEGGVQEKAIG